MIYRESGYFGRQSGPFDFLWKLEILSGLTLVLAGILVVLFPAILVAIVAAVIITAGCTLIGMGWRMRKLERHGQRVSHVQIHQL